MLYKTCMFVNSLYHSILSVCLSLCTVCPDCLGVKEQHKIEKFDGEEKMLEQYEFFMKLMEKFEALNGRSWKSLLDDAEEQDLKVREGKRGGGGME